MFYYISFLRPPPTQSSTNTPLFITPQIANDLRTEVCPNHHDIFYQWLPSPSRPQKLTSWNPTNPYPKPVPVPPPTNARPGQSYVLALSSSPATSIPLGALNDCPVPFPVLSHPVAMHKGKDQGKKQEKIDRVYTLLENAKLVITEQTSFDLDKKIWDSGIGLSAWITDLAKDYPRRPDRHPELIQSLRKRLFGAEACNIIELGAGTGIVSLALASLRTLTLKALSPPAGLSESDNETPHRNLGRILTTDLSTAIPLLEENIEKNASSFKLLKPEAMVLDWDHCEEFVFPLDGPQNPSSSENLEWDIIVMADVTYNTSSFPSLIKTLFKLLKSSRTAPALRHGHQPLVLLGYKQRDASERQMFELLKEELGLALVRVGSVEGWPGSGENGGTQKEEIEIWLGTVS
jgi:hypothetical protein